MAKNVVAPRILVHLKAQRLTVDKLQLQLKSELAKLKTLEEQYQKAVQDSHSWK